MSDERKVGDDFTVWGFADQVVVDYAHAGARITLRLDPIIARGLAAAIKAESDARHAAQVHAVTAIYQCVTHGITPTGTV